MTKFYNGILKTTVWNRREGMIPAENTNQQVLKHDKSGPSYVPSRTGVKE